MSSRRIECSTSRWCGLLRSGEAAGRVPEEVRTRHTDIPWRQIVGMRNRLTHGYDAVDLDILWEVIAKDLPPLVQRLEAILAKRQ